MAEKKGFFGKNLFWKILILIAVGVLVSVLLFQVPLTIPDIFWTIIKVLFAVGLLLLALKGIEAVIGKNEFSPSQRWKDRLIRVAELSKPFNVRELYIRGEDMRVYSRWGNITGLAYIPYLSAKPKLSPEGKIMYVQKKDHNKKPMIDAEGNPIMEIDKEYLTEKDGEWAFVVQRGLPIFATKEIVRARIDLCSDIGEKVWIKTPNLLPIGDYFYPAQQFQGDIVRLKVQHQAEIVIETYHQFMDLIGQLTYATLQADPNFRRAQEQNTEAINQNNAPQVTGGGK